MAEPAQILERLLNDLNSEDGPTQLAAIRELGSLNFSSQAIVARLEQLALHETQAVKNAAFEALRTATSRNVYSSRLNPLMSDRVKILEEIRKWETDGIIPSDLAEVLRRRYDFDILPARPEGRVEETAQAPAPAIPEPAAPSEPPAPPVPVGPRPTLIQTLLSETSIKIALYLGAFFVIASAAILAALVQAARLPILFTSTAIFAGGAIALKKRLPQPSYALFIVFSFLLLIDANVIRDQLRLEASKLDLYWALVFLLMSLIWGFSTWFYSSRLFSLAAFGTLSLFFYRSGSLFHTEPELLIFLEVLAALIGLASVRWLKKWQSSEFAVPLFLFAQFQITVLVFMSFFATGFRLINSEALGNWWLVIALTWLCAAGFYALSNLLFPFMLFPWAAIGALLPIPWMTLNVFHAPAPVMIAGSALWGMCLALLSEAASRRERIREYGLPFLTGSLPLFLIAAIWGFVERIEYGFAALLWAGLVSVGIHVLRPRWPVWTASLLFGLSAYFTFFNLPFMERTELALPLKLLIPAALLLLPDLFLPADLRAQPAWRWPLRILASILTFVNIVVMFGGYDHQGVSAIAFAVQAILFVAYGHRYKIKWIGYLGLASLALTARFTLQHFRLDLWLQVFTAMAVLYYALGLLVRQTSGWWSGVLRSSGLALGGLVTLVALFTTKETGGWYAAAVAGLFAAEMHLFSSAWLEIGVQIALSIGLYLILKDFNVREGPYYLFGLSLVWLGSDLILNRTFKPRQLQPVARAIGGLLAGATTFYLLLLNDRAWTATICFAVYTLFFAMYALTYAKPLYAYAATASLPLTVIFALRSNAVDRWLFPVIVIAILYYAMGYGLRRSGRNDGWTRLFLLSGLGLGVLTAGAALFQPGGLEKAIPVALAASLFALEAFARRNVWLGFPANALYLMAYFVILNELKVEQPQFFSVGTAALGMLMHYLLVRTQSRTGAFLTGMVSQLVLLGTTYIQMSSTKELGFFVVLFFQALAVLLYGIVIRSRSLVFTPISFAVLGVVTVVYTALKGISAAVLIGCTGIALLLLGIAAVISRERLSKLGERLSDWRA